VDVRETGSDKNEQKVIFINDSVETANDNFDEVFEAFVAEERCGSENGSSGFENELIRTESGSRNPSKVFMKELKQVLVTTSLSFFFFVTNGNSFCNC